MYILKTEASFDSAHFLAGYNGKCSNLHGHRWKIVLEVQTEELKEDVQHKGMYVDFGELKKRFKKHSRFNGSCINYRKKFIEGNYT